MDSLFAFAKFTNHIMETITKFKEDGYMFEKVLLGWYKSMGLVCGWYTKRNDFVAGLLYPALVAFIALWLAITFTVGVAVLVCMLVCLPFRGINGLGEAGKEFTNVLAELWSAMVMGIFEEESEEEPEETVEEPVEKLVEELVDPDEKLMELDNEIEECLNEHLDDDLDESEES